jgi:hypothetical protein
MNSVNRDKFIYNMVNLHMKSLYMESPKGTFDPRASIGYFVETEGDDGEYMRSIRAYIRSHKDTCQHVVRQSLGFYHRHPLLADAINTILMTLDARLLESCHDSSDERAIEHMDADMTDGYMSLSSSFLPVINDLSCRQCSDDDMMRIMMFFSKVSYEHAHTPEQQADDILRVCDEVHPTYDMFVSLFTNHIIRHNDGSQFTTIALYSTCPSYREISYADICSVFDDTLYTADGRQ